MTWYRGQAFYAGQCHPRWVLDADSRPTLASAITQGALSSASLEMDIGHMDGDEKVEYDPSANAQYINFMANCEWLARIAHGHNQEEWAALNNEIMKLGLQRGGAVSTTKQGVQDPLAIRRRGRDSNRATTQDNYRKKNPSTDSKPRKRTRKGDDLSATQP